MGKELNNTPLVFKLGVTHEGQDYYYNTEKASNFHISLLGNSGVGKSYNMVNILLEYYKQGITSLVIDTQGDFEYSKLPEHLLSSTPPSAYHRVKFGYVNPDVGINPLEILITDSDSDFQFALYNAIYSIKLSNPSLGSQQEALLKNLLVELYAKHGIYEGDRASWVNPSPNLTDLKNLCLDKQKAIYSEIDESVYESIAKIKKELHKHLAKEDNGGDLDESYSEKKHQLQSELIDMLAVMVEQNLEELDHSSGGASLPSKERIGSVLSIVKNMADLKLYSPIPMMLKAGKINVLDVTEVHQADLPTLFNLLLFKTFQRSCLIGKKNMNPKRPSLIIGCDEGKLFQTSKGNPMAPINRIITEGRKYGLGALIGFQSPEQIENEIKNSIGTSFILPVAKTLINKTSSDFGINKLILSQMKPRKEAAISSGNSTYKLIDTFPRAASDLNLP